MKIRGKLVVAFLLITLFPVGMFLLSSNFIIHKEADSLNDNYYIECDGFENMINPYKLLHKITERDYNMLIDTAENQPEKLLNTEYLTHINNLLQNHHAFLILRHYGSDVFIGNQELYDKMPTLPAFHDNKWDNQNLTFMDQKNSIIIQKIDYYYRDNSEGQLFLATDVSGLFTHWHQFIWELLFSYLLIIFITALLLIAWIYRSIVLPLNILRIATHQIGAGNLDQPVQILSTDEIGELCRDFDEMRLDLKNMMDEQTHYEENMRSMISSISHDLQTPLTAIKGYAEGILDGIAQTPEMQEKYLHTVLHKANDMTYLIGELALFAQMEQDILTYHFTPLDVTDYFSDCMEDLELDIETMGMKLSYYNNTAAGTQIYADPEQLKRVIYNIVNNAVKYACQATTTLHVRIEETLPQNSPPSLYRQLSKDGTDLEPQEEPPEYIRIQIEDEGPGIPAQDLPHIFDRFYRADTSRSSSTGGSGLGLSIAQKIITDHGGNVWAESIEGVGTSINFVLKKYTGD